MRIFRKIASILLVMIISASAAYADGVIPNLWPAEPSAVPAGGFSFRNGICWNMNKNQVLALENVQMSERSNGEWAVLCSYSPVEVSRFSADLVYMFRNDQLKMISYDFGTNGTAEVYSYLTGALTSVYGESSEPDAQEIVSVMDRIYPGFYTADRLHLLRRWSGDDSTSVYLYYYSEKAFAIFYVNREMQFPGGGQYITTGL